MLAPAAYLLPDALALALASARRAGALGHFAQRKVHRDPILLAGGWGIFTAISLLVWSLPGFEAGPR